MTETPERHPTYFDARDVYQRLADMLPLVDKLCFVAEHGEVVSLRKVVDDAIGEIFRLQRLANIADEDAGLVDRLRALAACRHDDHSIATEAADELVRLRAMNRAVLDGTHTIVPKETTDAMIDAAAIVWTEAKTFSDAGCQCQGHTTLSR